MESSYYAQLPTDILLSKDLTCFQKLLYADIQSLTFRNGYCFASNSYLAERHNKTEEHISRQISKLIELQHLFVVDNKGGHKSAGKRKLFTESTFLRYAKEKGIQLDLDKNIKVEPLKIDKNIKHSNISKSLVNEEFTKVNSPQGGQGLTTTKNNTTDTINKRTLLKQIKKPIEKPKEVLNVKHMNEQTIELLDYWNSFDSLTTHALMRKRTVSPLHKQSKTINKIHYSLTKLLNGSLYKQHPNVQAALKNKKYSIEEIKKSIERMALASTPEYSKSPKRPSLTNFLHNPHMEVYEGKMKYRFAYPFLHFLNNTPVKVSDSPTKVNTEYTVLVDKTLKKLTGTVKPTDKHYNQVAKQINKAVEFLKKKSNGNFAENRMRLPNLLIESLIENGNSLTVQDLPLGVYNLEKLMKNRLMIK